MTPNEYRKKHRRCATCEYFFNYTKTCMAKNTQKFKYSGRFCRVYKPKEFEV